MRGLPSLSLLLLALLLGCPAEDPVFADPPPPPEPVDPSQLCNEPGATRCADFDYEVCVEGRWFRQETCQSPTPQCDPELGCTGCQPEQSFCAGAEIWTCNADGSSIVLTDTCGAGESCLLGACYSSCEIAEQTNSYLGCRFLAVTTANAVDAAFSDDFAVVVANPSETDSAEVVIQRDGSTVQTASIPPRQVSAIQLDMLPELQELGASRRLSGAAYEISSSVPVAAYQFSPLHFEVEIGGSGEVARSFSNDASLLLPEHVLTGTYMASTWPTWAIGDFPGASEWLPGFIAIAATEDGTLVEIQSSARTQDGVPSALEPGETTTVSLQRADVLQIFSESPEASLSTNTCIERGGEEAPNGENTSCIDRSLGDLTGTLVSADKPVAVFAGHVCTFVPFDSWACDHLEEMMFPAATWGSTVVMTAPAHPSGSGRAAAMYRVLALEDGTEVSFLPAEVHEGSTLQAGGFVEFLSDLDFRVEGSGPILVTQALLGEQALGSGSGDPALGTGIPSTQWRSEYDFLTPSTYETNWVSVAVESGTDIYLDGQKLDGWEPISGTNLSAGRFILSSGVHRIESVGDVGFAITSHGYAVYTSYLYPGGLNFLR